jgi:hypothetical protein
MSFTFLTKQEIRKKKFQKKNAKQIYSKPEKANPADIHSIDQLPNPRLPAKPSQIIINHNPRALHSQRAAHAPSALHSDNELILHARPQVSSILKPALPS